MRIAQINPGLISIPPNGWGAIEKIIWNYKLSLEKLGHVVDIVYPNEVQSGVYDAVHVHVANQALMLAEQNIPYIFTMHDHHAYVWGKDQFCYQQNNDAIAKSAFSIVPAEYLIRYFDHYYKTFYLPHGVDTNYFTLDLSKTHFIARLLCVANNGFIHNQSEDRKGFRYAIEAAKQLNLPITIAGPKNNKNFFDANQDLLTYDKLTIKYDLDEKQLKELYQDHTIFIHASSAEAGHPNLTLLEAMACGLPIVGTYEGSIPLKGMIKVGRNTDEVVNAIREIRKDIPMWSNNAVKTAAEFDYSVIANRLESIYKGFTHIADSPTREDMRKNLLNFYGDIKIQDRDSKQPQITVNVNFINGAFAELGGYGLPDKKYRVEFIDTKNMSEIYSNSMPLNHWSKANRQYFTDWLIKVYDGNMLIHQHRFDGKGKRIYVHLDSKSLGDTLAWFPYVEEFRKKHQCKLICSTFWNKFFEKSYPEIEFVSPGTTVNNIYAMFNIGWFYFEKGDIDYSKNVYDFKQDPLQKTAADILGLEYKEIVPKIWYDPKLLTDVKAEKRKKYVCIGIHSTAQCKYWNNPTGWQEVVDYLTSSGYDVYHIAKERGNYMGNIPPVGVIDKTGDIDIYDRIKDLLGCEMFIGISSGLSWLAWALGVKTILISGMTKEYNEFTPTKRIINKNVCYGCMNIHKLDGGDWNWCPEYKNTPRQFECSKKIYGSDVISAIKQIQNS